MKVIRIISFFILAFVFVSCGEWVEQSKDYKTEVACLKQAEKENKEIKDFKKTAALGGMFGISLNVLVCGAEGKQPTSFRCKGKKMEAFCK